MLACMVPTTDGLVTNFTNPGLKWGCVLGVLPTALNKTTLAFMRVQKVVKLPVMVWSTWKSLTSCQ